MIKCANCGQLNDVYYLKKIAINKLNKQVKTDLHKLLNNIFKNDNINIYIIYNIMRKKAPNNV